jgi:hypothetical protein
MPMDRTRYPKNWDAIARARKEAAGWRCEQCDRPCRKPGENRAQFEMRLIEDEEEWLEDLWEYEVDGDEDTAIALPRFVRFVLTVAHLNQDPGDNRPDNLKALCSVCHLNHDRPFQQQNAMGKRERRGQTNIFDLTEPKPAGHGKQPNQIQIPIRVEER